MPGKTTRWRPWVRAIHRDIGYAAAALTIAYAISGLAVNHIEDWNPNYQFDERIIDVGPLPGSGSVGPANGDDGSEGSQRPIDLDAMEAHVVAALALDPATVRGRLMASTAQFQLFLPNGGEVRVQVATGRGTVKTVRTRPFLYEANALHLNNLKGIWTWVADIYALALLTLAITGLFISKGRVGLSGRGKWFAGAGLMVPVIFVIYLYWGPASGA